MTTNARHVLVVRLDTGWIVCEREADPAKRTRLEDHWISLLHAYEAACHRELVDSQGVA
jgi:hypothetical protein